MEELTISHSMSENSKNSDEHDYYTKTLVPGLRITLRAFIMDICWFLAIGTFGYYLYVILLELLASEKTPSTNVSYALESKKPFPAVTVCNWNTEGNSLGEFLAPCEFCTLQYISCNRNGYEACNLEPTQIQFNTSQAGTFYCYQFNNDPSNPTFAFSTGYGGSYSLKFEVNVPPGDVPLARIGLQATFHQNGTVPDVYDEINYALPDTDTLFAIRELENYYLNGTNTVNYEVTSSSVKLTSFDNSPNSSIATVFVSFAYQTLNTEVVTEISTYTLTSFLGDVAGMAGLLMGLDVLKLTRGVLAISKAVTRKSIHPIVDVFNG